MKLTAPVPGGPCWIELSTSDVPAAKSFYSALFGWRCETDSREEAGGYTMAHLGDDRVAALSPVYQPGQPLGLDGLVRRRGRGRGDREGADGGRLAAGRPDGRVRRGQVRRPRGPVRCGVLAVAGPRLRRRRPVQRTGRAGLDRARHPRERAGCSPSTPASSAGRSRPRRRTRSGVSTGRTSAAC